MERRRKREGKKRRRRKKKEEEKFKKSRFENSFRLCIKSMDYMYGILILNSCLELLYLLVWNLFVWICWLGHPASSLFSYVL